METTENNKLIAEFMGWKIGHPELLELRWGNEWFEGRDKKTTKGYLHFNSDWNWIMEVVDKVYSSDIYYDKYIEHNSSMFSSGKIKLSANIDHVYKQIVEFIKWYNQNQ